MSNDQQANPGIKPETGFAARMGSKLRELKAYN